ncbi:MAG TPA: hypothetical protein VGO93_31195 [Candidatus Xenobia bacterium]|jgi:uncharacterized membrane protein
MSNSPSNNNLFPTLSYLFIPAIVFLVLEPYKNDASLRRHAFHGIVIGAAWIILCIALSLVYTVAALLRFAGLNVLLGGVSMILFPLLSLAGLALTVMLMLKAWDGSMLQVPVLTDIAERFASKGR